MQNSSYIRVANSGYMNMFRYTKLFILLIDKKKLELNSPFNTMTFDLVNSVISNQQDFPTACIRNRNNYSPNYDVKCMIGMPYLQRAAFKSFSLFDLSQTGITNYRQDVSAKTYTTLCWRMAKCPTEFPFYNNTANTCDNCLLYNILNGTLPQLCE
jgi:hypothetical protein